MDILQKRCNEFSRMKLSAIDSILVQIAGVDTETEYENIASERLKSINICLAELALDDGSEVVIKSDLGDLAIVRVVFISNITFDVNITTRLLMDYEILPWNRKE